MTRQYLLSAAAILVANSLNAEPVYDRNDLVRPADLDRWVFVGSNLGLAYKDETKFITDREEKRQHAEMFHNVYMETAAYLSFMESGAFPDKTMFAFEVYTAETKEEDPSNELNGGFFNSKLQSIEVSIKDKARMESGVTDQVWACYAFGLKDGELVDKAEAMPDGSWTPAITL